MPSMKVFGYEFNTKETVKLFRHKDVVIDDVALARPTPSNIRTPLGTGRPSSLPALSRGTTFVDQNSGQKVSPIRNLQLDPITGHHFYATSFVQNSQDSPCSGLSEPILVQRCVIVPRLEGGFGLTVTGDNPVFVQTVKEDGAAARAGVLQGDRVLKVHGTVVTGFNHMDVVKMISSSGPYVSLTLLGRVPEYQHQHQKVASASDSQPTSPTSPPQPILRHSQSTTTPTSPRPMSCPAEHIIRTSSDFGIRNKNVIKAAITAPKPVNTPETMSFRRFGSRKTSKEEKRAEWRRNRGQMISQMLDEEKRHLQELLYQNRRNTRQDDKATNLINSARKRVKNLEAQLADITNSTDMASCSRQDDPCSTVSPPQHASILEECESNGLKTAGMHFISPRQVDVIPMEEDDDDGGEEQPEIVAPLEPQGPFSNFADLKSRPAHLSVFLHYLISNSDPASLLFFLITDVYQHGNSKELKRWAYEIHSSFLVPGAPGRVQNIDRDTVETIDTVLAADSDDITLRRLFSQARNKAIDDINDRLADFRTKRVLGLGPIYGDEQLKEVERGDKNEERRVADKLLMQHFDYFFSGSPTPDFEHLSDRKQALASALATVVKNVLGVKPMCNLQEKLLEKCPTYVSKDKSAKFKLSKVTSKKAVQIKGHQFLLQPVFNSTVCYICEKMLWGINSQGYFCSNCDVVLHKQCTGSLEDTCYPASQKAKRPYLKSTVSKTKTAKDIDDEIIEEPEGDEELDKTTDLPSSPVGRDQSGAKCSPADSGYGGDSTTDKERHINRSQSMRTRLSTTPTPPPTTSTSHPSTLDHHHSMLVKSDTKPDSPDLLTMMRSNVDVDEGSITQALSNDRSDQSINTHSSHSDRSLPDPDELQRMLEEATGDSDMDVEHEKPDLHERIEKTVFEALSVKQRKRQEVILELIHTERSHVRNLKVLLKVFYTPLLVEQVLSPDMVKLLFANLEEVLQLHSKLSRAVKMCRDNKGYVKNIGEAMLSVIDGEDGVKFGKAVATFCQHQQYALDVLRGKMKKDAKLQQFLVEAESSNLCRRHQLKDMLPYEMQRLTKYPLLLETIAKYCDDDSDEMKCIKKAVDRSKHILAEVNDAKRNSENLRRLEDLQRRLDTTPFDKENHQMTAAYRRLDLREHRLIHEGRLTWKIAKNKTVDLYVVLLEELLVMLTDGQSGNKLVLRFYDTSISVGKFCPLLKLSSLMPKEVATDRKAFFLVCTSSAGPQILELTTQTMAEKKIWFRSITDQVQICKQREEEKERSNAPPAPSSDEQDTSRISDSHSDENRQSSSEEEGAVGGRAEAKADRRARDSQRLQILSQPRLINPSEIEITKPTVLQHAEPVLTDIERIRRSDQLLASAMSEKQLVIARLFAVENAAKMETLADDMSAGDRARGSRELIMATVVQANRLLECINEGMKVNETECEGQEESKLELASQVQGPAVSCFKLTGIVAPMMRHLTALMHSLDENEYELQRTRQELSHYKSMVDNCGSKKEEEPLSDLGSSPSSVGSTSYHQNLAVAGKEIPLILSPLTPRLSVGPTSSEETLTDSKVGTPLTKTPDGLCPSPTSVSNKLRSPSPRLSVDTTPKDIKGSTSSLSAIDKKKGPTSPNRLNAAKSAQKIAQNPASSSPPTRREVKVLATANVNAHPTTLEGLPPTPATHAPPGVAHPAKGGPRTPSPKSLEEGLNDEAKKERRKQKRQRHAALVGSDDPRTSPPETEPST